MSFAPDNDMVAYANAWLAVLDAIPDATPEKVVALARAYLEAEKLARQIEDPSYVGNYSDADVVVIYRAWASAFLAEHEPGAE